VQATPFPSAIASGGVHQALGISLNYSTLPFHSTPRHFD